MRNLKKYFYFVCSKNFGFFLVFARVMKKHRKQERNRILKNLALAAFGLFAAMGAFLMHSEPETVSAQGLPANQNQIDECFD